MGTYASDTKVSRSRSQDEIERTLARYGVHHFACASQPGAIMVEFQAKESDRFRIVLPVPQVTERRFTTTDQGRPRSDSARQDLHEQEVRQRWRALALVVKANLELAELTGQPLRTTFAQHLVLGNGRTVAEHVEQDRGAPPALPWQSS